MCSENCADCCKSNDYRYFVDEVAVYRYNEKLNRVDYYNKNIGIWEQTIRVPDFAMDIDNFDCDGFLN